jgi:polyisoprenoid-binding protein YceI
MFNFRRRLSLVLAVATTSTVLFACATAPSSMMSPNSAWVIEASQSSLNFVTTKAGQPGVAGIGEIQTFKRFSGGLDNAGQIKLSIDLASVDTGIEIRDERLRTLLWNVKATPQAVFSAKLTAENVAKMATAGVADLDVVGQLELAGQSKPVTAKLRVSRLGADKIMVVTRAPILINSSDFGLRAGVEALREVMGLNFVSAAAPVSFALVLNHQR